MNDGIEPQPPQPHQVAQPQRPQSEERILRLLESPIVVHEDASLLLDQALQMLGMGLPSFSYYLDAMALRESGIHQTNILVSIPQTDGLVTKKDLLNTILEPHGLAYVVRHEMLIITSKKAARGNKIHRLHYVGDLISDLGDLAPETFTGGMGGMMGDIANPSPEIMKMFDIITTVIEPDSWWNGDAFLSFHPATQSLAIRHFEDVHVQIEDMFAQMREANDEADMASAPQLEEQANPRPLTLRERMRARTLASPISPRQALTNRTYR